MGIYINESKRKRKRRRMSNMRILSLICNMQYPPLSQIKPSLTSPKEENSGWME